MNPKTKSDPRRPPEASTFSLSRLVATIFGLGDLTRAPGTLGSLAGVAISWLDYRLWLAIAPPNLTTSRGIHSFELQMLLFQLFCTLLIAYAGVLAAGTTAAACGKKDPQFIVIDEVSGQHLALAIGFGWVNWKYFLLGFILFRAFDIWKPFPVRQAEALPGGWGIMADDWIAAGYAAIGLWIAWAAGL